MLRIFDYCLSSAERFCTSRLLALVISRDMDIFFYTEEAHAVMLDKVADRSPVDHRSSGPGSSGKSAFKAPAQFGEKKDIHMPQDIVVIELKQ